MAWRVPTLVVTSEVDPDGRSVELAKTMLDGTHEVQGLKQQLLPAGAGLSNGKESDATTTAAAALNAFCAAYAAQSR